MKNGGLLDLKELRRFLNGRQEKKYRKGDSLFGL